MYVRVLQDELVFPDDRAIDQDTKSLIRGVNTFWLFASFDFAHICIQLLQRNPALRICEPRIKRHPYFSMMYVLSTYTCSLRELTAKSLCSDWSHVYYKRYIRMYPCSSDYYSLT